MSNETTLSGIEDAKPPRGAASESLALMIAGFTAEPQRAGEIAFLPKDRPLMLGRGDEGEGRVSFVRQRPGRNEPAPPLGGAGLSRDQARVVARGDRVEVELTGKAPLTHLDAEVERCTLRVGDAIILRGQLTLICVSRPKTLPALQHFPVEAIGAFGAADRFGLLGESPAIWQLRDRLAFAAQSNGHLLCLGESGTGKELVANAVHQLSSRAGKAFVARNAATFPKGLIDAELFGHAKNYPNAGMNERPGLIGEADGGTLFLDELAELPSELQSHLLRVLDEGGEYQRLGDSATRRSRFVLVGATNRDPSALKHDLLARFVVQLRLPALRDHLDDLPLLAGHLMRRARAKSPELVDRFFADVDGASHPRIHPRLLCALLDHGFDGNVRELDALLWQAMSESSGNSVLGSEELLRRLRSSAEPPAELSAGQVKEELARQDGNITATARALRLPSRFALYRLMKKLAVE